MTTSASIPLFRQEALDAQKTQWLGSIVLIRPLSFSIVCATSVVIAFAVLALLAFGEYTKRARVLGVLAPEHGVIKVMPPQAGLIVAKYVVEGQRVAEGDKLFKISLERNTAYSGAQVMGSVQPNAGGGASQCCHPANRPSPS